MAKSKEIGRGGGQRPGSNRKRKAICAASRGARARRCWVEVPQTSARPTGASRAGDDCIKARQIVRPRAHSMSAKLNCSKIPGRLGTRRLVRWSAEARKYAMEDRDPEHSALRRVNARSASACGNPPTRPSPSAKNAEDLSRSDCPRQRWRDISAISIASAIAPTILVRTAPRYGKRNLRNAPTFAATIGIPTAAASINIGHQIPQTGDQQLTLGSRTSP
jgi:hypothetical protein